MTGRGSTTYTYNGDGVLVDDGTTRSTQNLASPLNQVLQSTQGSATTDSLYGTDALGSVRQSISDAGMPLGVVNFDPWGALESGNVLRFGFTGALQDTAAGLVNLRARWYSTTVGAGSVESIRCRTYAKAILACGSMVLFFFSRYFFALRGEKSTYTGLEMHDLRKAWFNRAFH